MSSFSTGLYGSTISSIVGNVNDAFSGKSSGIDVSSVVGDLMELERLPEVQLQNQQTTIKAKIDVLNKISAQMSTLYDSVNALKDFFGVFSQKAVGSSNPALVSAAADRSAASGTHTVVVGRLATVSSAYSDCIAAGSSLAGTQLVVKYGSDADHPVKSESIDIPATSTTLQQAASYINGGGFGVSASVVSDTKGSRLVLTSKTSGSDGNLTIESGATSFTTAAGVNAQLSVDGVPVDSSTNTVTGAIEGVTLSLGAADPDASVLISVQPDTAAVSQAVQDFVDGYNAVVNSINAQFTVGGSGKEGVLAGDSMLRSLQTNLLKLVGGAVKGAGSYVNLQSMGLEMQNDGSLQIDSTKFSTAMSGDFAEVQKFFQSTAPAGWGQSVSAGMLKLISPTQGPIGLDIAGLKNTNATLTDQINDFEVRMGLVQDRLTAQYSNLNALLQQYPLLMQQIASQLSSLPNASSNKG
jgi:flagellar hook-associated protein 2